MRRNQRVEGAHYFASLRDRRTVQGCYTFFTSETYSRLHRSSSAHTEQADAEEYVFHLFFPVNPSGNLQAKKLIVLPVNPLICQAVCGLPCAVLMPVRWRPRRDLHVASSLYFVPWLQNGPVVPEAPPDCGRAGCHLGASNLTENSII